MRLQKYNITVEYLKGKSMFMADTLSRAYLPTSTGHGPQDDIEYVHMTQFLPITDRRMSLIRQATEEDPVLQTLKRAVMTGWPNDKQALPPELGPYFPYRDEITVADGIVLKGERVVIPSGMRKTIKEKVHSSHLGINGCLRRARECLFWPNMTSDIRDFISSCSICRELETRNQKETLMSHDIPDRPWAKIGTDLLSLFSNDYLITADYFSNFFEIDRLHNTTSAQVIKKLKAHFARYGVPEVVVSDNGPQYASEEFEDFAREWDFEHRTTSPGNSKGNGKVESAVKTAKRLLIKARRSNSDPFLSLLDHRNTPSEGLESSPAQRLMGRRTRTLLPTTNSLLRPATIDHSSAKLGIRAQQMKQQFYFNKHAKDLPHLEEGDVVRMQPFTKGKKTWDKAVVSKRLDQRSYEVVSDKGVYRRNRVHVKKTSEQPPCLSQETPTCPTEPATTNPMQDPPTVVTCEEDSLREESKLNPQGSSNNTPVTTRSGRVIQPPARYRE